MLFFSGDMEKIFTDFKHDKLLKKLQDSHTELIQRRVDFVEYGNARDSTAKQRTMLTCQLLRQCLVHRAERLLVATGHMLLAKNVYGLALVARGHVEATAVLAYFCKRIDSLSKGRIDFEKFEYAVANSILGAKHELFSEADAPTNIVTCVEDGDKFLDSELFDGKKNGFLRDIYGWLSEFAHPNFCSNTIAFTLDKATGRAVFRHDNDLQESDFQLINYLSMSAEMFTILFDEFGKRVDMALTE
jgi:hypothetical protein